MADCEKATVGRGVCVMGQDRGWGSLGPETTQTVTEVGKTTHRSGGERLELERGRGPGMPRTSKLRVDTCHRGALTQPRHRLTMSSLTQRNFAFRIRRESSFSSVLFSSSCNRPRACISRWILLHRRVAIRKHQNGLHSTFTHNTVVVIPFQSSNPRARTVIISKPTSS